MVNEKVTDKGNELLPPVESIQFGSYLIANDLVTWPQLQMALSLQRRRPFLHLGELLSLMGLIDDWKLGQVLAAYNRESRLGSILVAAGRISIAQLAEALEQQAEREEPLGEILVSMGHLSRSDLELALEHQGLGSATSKDLFDKVARDPQVQFFREAQAEGVYPYFRPVEAAEGPRSRVANRDVVMLAANSYLGLSNDPAVIEASIETTRRYGVGTSGSPMLNGTMDLHLALERELCEFTGWEAAMLCSTGFQTNLAILAGLVGRGDVVLIDSIAHASLHDGARLAAGEVRRFNHNNMAHLEQQLKAAGARGKLVVVDGVYSMDGDLADLPSIVKLAKAYGARVLVDDAHGFGVLGMTGRGTLEYFRLMEEVDLLTFTFSKALGTIGGCVLGKREVIDFLKHRSRPFIFSATLPPGTVGATRASLRRLATDPSLRHRLSRNVDMLRTGLLEMGYRLGASHTHILPVHIGDDQLALRLGCGLLEAGVFVGTVVSPGVPPGQARLRVTPMASHSMEDMVHALDAFERVGTAVGAIGPDAVRLVKEKVIPAHKEEPSCSK